MKKDLILIISIQFTLLLSLGCNLKGNINDDSHNSTDTLTCEDFDSFYKKFNSDSVFQMSRIIFPFESEKESEREYAEALEDTSIEVTTANSSPDEKENWIMLRDTLSKNDSIISAGGVKYKRRFYKTPILIEENILYADPEQLMIIIKFKLINNKWYLIDFQDGFADEG